MNSKRKKGRILFSNDIWYRNNANEPQCIPAASPHSIGRIISSWYSFVHVNISIQLWVQPKVLGDRCGFNGFSSFWRKNAMNLLSNLNSHSKSILMERTCNATDIRWLLFHRHFFYFFQINVQFCSIDQRSCRIRLVIC